MSGDVDLTLTLSLLVVAADSGSGDGSDVAPRDAGGLSWSSGLLDGAGEGLVIVACNKNDRGINRR